MDEEKLRFEGNVYNPRQFKQIRLGLKEGLDIDIYAHPKFTSSQMLQIRLGLLQDLDITKYADPKFNADQMEQIRKGLHRNLDVNVYADTKYNSFQMRQIRWGLQDGLDPLKYNFTDPDLSASEMRKICKKSKSIDMLIDEHTKDIN